MYEYSHGGNAAFEPGNAYIDLSANINPLGLPEGITSAVSEALAAATSYPDSFSRQLRLSIAGFEGVDPEWIFCGNGASDIIFRLPRAINARKVMVTAPAFSDYERAAASFGSLLARHYLQRDEGFQITDDILESIAEQRPDLLFICNPNNPTGQLTDKRLLARIIEICEQQQCYLAIDECFLDLTEQAEQLSCKDLLAQSPRLLLVKAFTKAFAMPGIRLGYAISANAGLLQGLYQHGPDWPVSNLAQAAGLAALESPDQYLQDSRGYIAKTRLMLEGRLAELGYRVYKASANYVFLHSPFAFDLQAELDSCGIRIRSCANYHGLGEGYYRIAVSTPANNDRLLAALARIHEQKAAPELLQTVSRLP